MAGKVSVTVPLTAQQKNKIRRATGKTISALKVESTGGATLKRALTAGISPTAVRMARPVVARVVLAKKFRAARPILAKATLAKSIV